MKQSLTLFGLEYKWVALIIINIATFAVSFDTGLVTLILPNIARDFQAGMTITLWVPMAKFLMMAAFMPIFGKISDIKGKKRYFNIGIIIFFIGTLLTAIASSIYEIPFYRALTGIGSAILIVNTRSMIVDIFPENERGKALGWHLFTVYLGHTLGPALGGIITSFWGWRYLFIILLPITIITLILSIRIIKEHSVKRTQKFDKIGSILLASALIFTLIPITFGPQRDWTPMDILITEFWIPLSNIFVDTFVYIEIPLIETLIIGLVFFTAFFITQLKIKEPIIDIKLFIKNKKFFSTNISLLLINTAHFSIYVVLAFYLGLVKLMDPFWTGIILAIFPLIAALVSPVSGWFSDKYDQREVRILAAGITTMSLFLLSRLTSASSVEYLIASLILLGIGVGLFSPANTTEALGSLPPHKRSYGNGMLGMMRYTGQTLSYAVSAIVIGLYLPTQLFIEGGAIAAEQYVIGIGQSLLFSVGLSAIAMIIAIVIRSKKEINSKD